MLEPFYKNKFKQDVARMKKRGKQLRKLQEVISMLIDQHELPLKYRDHSLLGQYNNCRECHIEPEKIFDFIVSYLITFYSVRRFSRCDYHGAC